MFNPTDFAMPTLVPVNGVKLEVFEAGRENVGNPIVLCHGWPEHAFSWRYQVPADYDIEHLSGDLVALLDRYGYEDATFVGHDWGAMVVWGLTLLHPRRVKRVINLSERQRTGRLRLRLRIIGFHGRHQLVQRPGPELAPVGGRRPDHPTANTHDLWRPGRGCEARQPEGVRTECGRGQSGLRPLDPAGRRPSRSWHHRSGGSSTYPCRCGRREPDRKSWASLAQRLLSKCPSEVLGGHYTAAETPG